MTRKNKKGHHQKNNILNVRVDMIRESKVKNAKESRSQVPDSKIINIAKSQKWQGFMKILSQFGYAESKGSSDLSHKSVS